MDTDIGNTADCNTGTQIPSSSCIHLRPFEMHGWVPDNRLSADDNFLDCVMLLTRNSTCRGGSMACVIARPLDDDDKRMDQSPDEFSQSLLDSIVCAAINQPLYSKQDSDVHAEISALGLSSRRGNATDGCTAYITMPPCKNCLGALVMAGIRRIVTRRKIPTYIPPVANKRGIQAVVLDDNHERKSRIDALVSNSKRKAAAADDDNADPTAKNAKHGSSL